MAKFCFVIHPCDLFRDTLPHNLPDMESEKFLVWFHPNYQGSQTVAEWNDLCKYLEEQEHGLACSDIVKKERKLYAKMQLEALCNFYSLLKDGKIKIID